MHLLRRYLSLSSEFLLINFFIFEVLASTISSQKTSSIIIKIFFDILLWIWICYDYKIKKHDIKNCLVSPKFKKLIGIILTFVLLLSISLIYSKNLAYGTFKLSNFLIGTVPTILAFYYLLITLNKSRIKIFFISLFFESTIVISLILLIKPFNYDGQAIITLTRWSHVIFGHFIGPVYFLFFFMLLKSEKKKELFFFSAGVFVALIGVYLSGLRAALTGVIFFSPLILILSIFLRDLNSKKLIFYFFAIIVSFLIVYALQPYTETINNRYISLFDISKPDLGDASLTARITGLEISWEIIKKYPLWGIGFGGFKNYNNIPLTNIISYPHNIFVEFLIELGIFGLLFFLFLLFTIFISTKRISLYITIFFCFALWLALFSKSIDSNTLLWLGLAFYGLNKNTVKKITLS